MTDLSAQEAAERLGVSRETLYAYVSRGLLHSAPVSSKSRARRYRAEDVEALLARRAARRDPEASTLGALAWGAPVLESALTLIEGGRLFYRGQDAARLAEEASVEEVAALLWTGEAGSWRALPLRARLAQPPLSAPGGLLETYAHALTHAAAHDLHAREARPEALPGVAARVLTLLYATTERVSGRPPAPDLPLHERLARAWGVPGRADLLRRALVLTADHELNVSAFTARVVASGGAGLHRATLAALSALQGVRHGLMTEEAHRLIGAALTGSPEAALLAAQGRLRQLPGFGHRLYPEGDPRAAALLAALPDHPARAVAEGLAERVRAELGERPNIDFALAALAWGLGLTAERALALFALGRSVGWLAHAIEGASGGLVRPRAVYVGARPDV